MIYEKSLDIKLPFYYKKAYKEAKKVLDWIYYIIPSVVEIGNQLPDFVKKALLQDFIERFTCIQMSIGER